MEPGIHWQGYGGFKMNKPPHPTLLGYAAIAAVLTLILFLCGVGR